MKKQGIVFFLISGISLVCLFVLRFLLGGWVDYLWVPLVLFVGALIAGLWTYRKLYREFFSLKTTKQGFSMGGMILLVFTLLVAVNFIGARKYKTFDFSSAQVNTLSAQSKTLLANLGDDLKVLYFYKRGTEGVEENRRAFIDLIKKYQDQSDRVKLSFIEVNENPKMAEDYGVNKGSGLVFIDYKGRRSKIEKIDEQELTGALVKVTREKDKKVYYLVGHRERDFEEAKDAMGLNAFKKLLEGNRYVVSPLNLNQVATVPNDADLVVIAGPEQAFLDHEIKALKEYLQAGGSALIAAKATSETGLKSLLEPISVQLKKQFVVQVMDTPLGKAVNPQATPVSDFNSAVAITKPFGRGEFVVMRLPNSIEHGTMPAGVTFQDLLKTDKNSMAFPDVGFKGAGVPGPFLMGGLVSGKYPGGITVTNDKDAKATDFNLVVIADVDFLSNQFLYKNLNRDLALNTVAYLVKEENIISITPKEVDVTQLQITETQFYLFIFGFIIPLPLLLVITSGVLWYRRRFA